MSQDRPVLTLKRKTSDGSEKKSGPVVIGSRKVIVATPGRVKRKKVVPPPPPPAPIKKETPAETFAREVAPPQPKKKAPEKPCGHSPRLMDPDEALMLLAAYWPALVIDGECRLMKVGIREDMFDDIARRELSLSRKRLRRMLKTLTRTDAYHRKIAVGAVRYDTQGLPAGKVTKEEAQ